MNSNPQSGDCSKTFTRGKRGPIVEILTVPGLVLTGDEHTVTLPHCSAPEFLLLVCWQKATQTPSLLSLNAFIPPRMPGLSCLDGESGNTG